MNEYVIYLDFSVNIVNTNKGLIISNIFLMYAINYDLLEINSHVSIRTYVLKPDLLIKHIKEIIKKLSSIKREPTSGSDFNSDYFPTKYLT